MALLTPHHYFPVIEAVKDLRNQGFEDDVIKNKLTSEALGLVHKFFREHPEHGAEVVEPANNFVQRDPDYFVQLCISLAPLS